MKEIFCFQGVKGAYSEALGNKFLSSLGVESKSVSCSSFLELFEKINEGILGVVPIENSNAGSVIECYDLFLKNPELVIISEEFLKINHVLASKATSLVDVKEVISHPQALSQCSDFLDKHKFVKNSFFDTAGSAKFLSENNFKEKACICSEFAAKKYGLNILDDNIMNSSNNTTRFFIVKNKNYNFEKILVKKNKTSIAFETKDLPSALYKCLGCFAKQNINLTKIESRPKGGENMFSFVFFLDFEGNTSQKDVSKCLKELEEYSNNLKVLGSY